MKYGDLEDFVGRALDDGAEDVSLHLTGVSLWPRTGPDRKIEHTNGIEIVYYVPAGQRRRRKTFMVVCDSHVEGLRFIAEWMHQRSGVRHGSR